MLYEYSLEDKDYFFVVGGFGILVIFLKVKMFYSEGKNIDIIIGGRLKENIFFEDELKKYCNNLYIFINDGFYGKKGFVIDILKEFLESGRRYDEIFVVGLVLMMKVVVDIIKRFLIKILVSFNLIMVDGIGMCGGCRVKIGNEVKFVCVDGFIFNGFEVDFDGFMKRNFYY